LIVLDTHVWIWWVDGGARLTTAQQEAIAAEQQNGDIGISAISCWEIALLTARGRLQLRADVLAWLRDELSYPGVRLLPLSPEVAVRANRLPEPFHRDPADRILVATALEHVCPLVTSDARILAYPHVTTIH